MTASVRTGARSLEEVLASLERLKAQLEAAEARLALPPEAPLPPPVRQLHRLRDP